MILPVFDEVDRIPYTNQITYGITQRLVGKPEKEGISSGPYEYGKLRIFQSYSLGDPFTEMRKGRRDTFQIFKENCGGISAPTFPLDGMQSSILIEGVSIY